jgi:hypothetical protein
MNMPIPKAFAHFIESNEDTWSLQESAENNLGSFPPRGREIFLPNEYYGLDLIVKKFIGIDPATPLKFGLPHGVEIGDAKFGNVYGYRINLGTITYNNEIGYQNIVKYKVPGRRIYIEHPFLLLLEMMHSLNLLSQKAQREATLFFPAHRDKTHNFVNKKYDEDLCSKLMSRREKEGEIEISLPLLDFEIGRHKKYESCGFKVVSSGHRNDPKFLSRFINLVTSYKQVASAEVGSHLVYSAATGAKTIFWDVGLPLVQPVDDKKSLTAPYEIDSSVRELLGEGQIIDKEMALKLLGWRGTPPAQISWQKLYKSSAIFDFSGFAEQKGENKTLCVPRVFQRFVARIIKGKIASS